MATPSTASAQAMAVKQPAVIGYPNERGVTIERVTYPARNMGTTIVANLFKPAKFSASKTYPAIVVTHPLGGVKEQTAGLYAQRLAEEGFITLAYDASYQGESGGEPHLMEVPAQRVDDISCAIDFLVQHPQIDPERIGSLGVCAGGYREGYEYYRTARAMHPNSPNRYVFSSLPLQMAFFPFDQLNTISPRPLLVIAGSKADTLFWSKEVYDKAKEPKELFVVDGATHIDMYDRPRFVAPAVTKLADFFNNALMA